jgi:hypothetical protein
MFNCAFKTVNFGSLIKRANRHFGIAILVPISRTLSRKIKWTQRISDINVKQNSTIHFMRGKVLPRAGHEGPEGEQRYSSTLSLTSALDEGGWSTPRPSRFTSGNDPVPIVQEAGWATGLVWMAAENLAPTGI